jgi:hypothetical protein
MSYILYRITEKNYFITKSDSDVINTIVDKLLGVGSDFGYGTGLSEAGKVIGSVMGFNMITLPRYEAPKIYDAPPPVKPYGGPPEMREKWEDEGKYLRDYIKWDEANIKYYTDLRQWYKMKPQWRDARYIPAGTNMALNCLDTSCAGMGYYIGGKLGAKIGKYTKINSDEEIYDMTDTTIINNPEFVFDKLIEIFKHDLSGSKYLSIKQLSNTLEYVYYVFDLILRWSDFNAIKSRFVLFGELYIDPILHRIANPQIPRMVRGVKTLRELSYDTVDENYTYEDIISKIGEESYLQATYNFRDVYKE